MSCRDAYKTTNDITITDISWPEITEPEVSKTVEKLLFGVDSKVRSDNLLQNNINQFEWVIRNKIYPNFWGRNITGDNALTEEEIRFIHNNGCKIALIYTAEDKKQTEDQGKIIAKRIGVTATELGIPNGVAVFLDLPENENVSKDFMLGFATALMAEGYTPGFRANTDAKFSFDLEFSRGMQTDKDVFKKCLIWAIAPTVKEYDGITTSHFIHPDNWMPYAPSGITRKEIAIWQYGTNCHPIEDNNGKETTFNLNLVRNDQVIMDKMF